MHWHGAAHEPCSWQKCAFTTEWDFFGMGLFDMELLHLLQAVKQQQNAGGAKKQSIRGLILTAGEDRRLLGIPTCVSSL